eukprot:1197064-Prymnesium_polylepis.2
MGMGVDLRTARDFIEENNLVMTNEDHLSRPCVPRRVWSGTERHAALPRAAGSRANRPHRAAGWRAASGAPSSGCCTACTRAGSPSRGAPSPTTRLLSRRGPPMPAASSDVASSATASRAAAAAAAELAARTAFPPVAHSRTA